MIDVKGREVDAAIVNTRDGWTKFGRETARWKGFGDQTRSGMRAVVLELWRQEGLVLGVAGHRMRRRPGHGRHLSRPRLSSHGCLSRAGDGSGSGSYEVQRAHRLRPEKPDLSKECDDGDAIRILCSRFWWLQLLMQCYKRQACFMSVPLSLADDTPRDATAFLVEPLLRRSLPRLPP